MLWYLSCPIKPVEGETYQDTKREGLDWYRFLLLQGLNVVAPYWGLLQTLDDTNPEERKLGMSIDEQVHDRCDGLVVVGGVKRVQASKGVQADILFATKRERPILRFYGMTEDEVSAFLNRFPTKWKRTNSFFGPAARPGTAVR